jgi:hypothetical protein
VLFRHQIEVGVGVGDVKLLDAAAFEFGDFVLHDEILRYPVKQENDGQGENDRQYSSGNKQKPIHAVITFLLYYKYLSGFYQV